MGHTQADQGAIAARRADAGVVRLSGRDVAGLVLCADMYGAPYDLLATYLGVREDRLRAIVARWRQAGYVATGRLGAGPTWCWVTRAGLGVTGLPYTPCRPAAARLAHLRAVLAVRLALEAGPAYQDGRAWWRCERRIRAAIGGRAAGHVPDAEVSWPDLPASPYPGECWAIEAELTPKPALRTVEIMTELLASIRYAQVIYLTAPGARTVVTRVAASLPPGERSRMVVRDLPESAFTEEPPR